jgi:hypothetical protein
MRTALVLALLALASVPLRAETILAGDRDALRVTTHDAAIDEVLGAFREKFDLRYRTGQPLTRRLNGTYVCALQRCVAQILAGYNYIIRSDAERVEVIVLGDAGAPKLVGTGGPPIARTARRVD